MLYSKYTFCIKYPILLDNTVFNNCHSAWRHMQSFYVHFRDMGKSYVNASLRGCVPVIRTGFILFRIDKKKETLIHIIPRKTIISYKYVCNTVAKK